MNTQARAIRGMPLVTTDKFDDYHLLRNLALILLLKFLRFMGRYSLDKPPEAALEILRC